MTRTRKPRAGARPQKRQAMQWDAWLTIDLRHGTWEMLSNTDASAILPYDGPQRCIPVRITEILPSGPAKKERHR